MTSPTRSWVPWWLRIAAKIALARLPVDYSTWQHMGLFRHGRMDLSGYLLDVFNSHVLKHVVGASLVEKTILELGPGDSVGTALIAASYRARAILVDDNRFAIDDVRHYKELANELSRMGLDPPDIQGAETLKDILRACRALYLTEGLTALSAVESGCVDILFSQAVLEHVRKHEFLATMRECRRVLSIDGFASHRVDLRDHLGGGLNNLRMGETVWESNLFTRSGFYTNRIRFSEMLSLFETAGFRIEMLQSDGWQEPPIPRRRLHKQFARLPDEDLIVKGFDVLLRPRGHDRQL